MTAELLRRAADLIERCAADPDLTPGPWLRAPPPDLPAEDRAHWRWTALLGPQVAAPLAAWLRDHADAAEYHENDEPGLPPDDYCAGDERAFALARVVLAPCDDGFSPPLTAGSRAGP